MLHFGKELTNAQHSMQPSTLETLFHQIRDDRQLREEIGQLRRVQALDKGSYTRLKTRLPYFCGARFREGYRKTSHFEAIHWMILDLDHLEAEIERNELRKQLIQDERVALLFTSPSGNGLKLVFKLEEPCLDTKQFSDAYKGFTYAFSQQYQLEPYLDRITHDVTRVCFLSHDPQAYHNPLCEPLDWKRYLPVPTLAIEALPLNYESDSNLPKPGKSHQIHPETYADILRKLQTKARNNPMAKPVLVPAVLEEVQPAIVLALEEQSIQTLDTRPIQYGYQFSVQSGVHSATFNLFFGKKGFSVVLVDKRKDHPELGELVCFLAEQTIYQRQHFTNGLPMPDEAPSPQINVPY